LKDKNEKKNSFKKAKGKIRAKNEPSFKGLWPRAFRPL
jgi:hypothetical protein